MAMRDEQTTGAVVADPLAPIRTELLLRIVLQNLTLLIAAAGFAGLAALLVGLAAQAWPICSAYAALSLALLVQWCHHGVRTMQIKQYITLQEQADLTSWEGWLPANRPDRLLGTRWLISTKGVFLGLQLAMAILAARLSPQTFDFFTAVCAGIFVASVALLVTNPKE